MYQLVASHHLLLWPDANSQDIMKVINYLLFSFAGKYDQIFPITTARVPIVKFFLRPWLVEKFYHAIVDPLSLHNKSGQRHQLEYCDAQTVFRHE